MRLILIYLIKFAISIDFTIINTSAYNHSTLNITGNKRFDVDLVKRNSNYSINDGVYIDYNNKITNPKHLQFSYFIPNTNKIESFEGCNVRLTNWTKEELASNNYRTNKSDPILFRIQSNNSITLNKQFYYFGNGFNNFNSTLDHNLVDLLINWDQSKVVILFNKHLLNVTKLSLKETAFDFFHDNLEFNGTRPNKLLLYNFHPNVNCSLRGVELCENFCDQESERIYLGLYSSSSNLSSLTTVLVFSFVYLLLIIN